MHTSAGERGGGRPDTETTAGDVGARAMSGPFDVPGEMAARCREIAWASTSLGAPEQWPPALRTVVRTCLESPFPLNLWCGPELLLVYNDAYRRVLGAKHPHALARPGLEVWSEIRAAVEPMFAQIRAGGPPVYAEDARFVMTRAGADGEHGEEAYFTFGLSAVRDEAGEIVAFLNPAAETTGRVLAERRLATANRALEVERARLVDVFRQAPSFLAVLRGREHVFELANAAYYQLVGHRDLVGRPLAEALPELRGQGFDELLDRVLATGEPFVGREIAAFLARSPDAPPEERFVDFVYLPLIEPDGTRAGIIAHGTDVTDHVRARREIERLLAESRQAQRALAEVNTQLEEQQVELELTNQQLQENAAELEAQAEDLQDTTAELEKRSVELEVERGRLARVLERLPVGVIVVDASGAVVTHNAALEQVLGHRAYQAADVEGYAEYGGLHPDGRPYAPGDYPVARALMHGETILRELTRYRRGDGSVVTLSISAAPVRDPDGRVEYAVAAVEDVNDRETARAAAEEANRAKSQFLANMSHELRTPLNAIQGHLQLLEMELHGALAPAQRETLGRIDRAQRHLLGLINDILGYARIESGRIEYDVQPTQIAEVVSDVMPIVEPLLLAKGLRFGARLSGRDGEAPVLLWADREKVGQVLLNLLSNAVKFTPSGGEVSVELSADPATVGSSELAFVHVRDTGVGIPPDKLEAIFEPFVQVRSAYSPGQGGTGLGLAISRDLARGMGGDLVARSAEGEGSVFTLTLRRVVTPAGEATDRRLGDERRAEEERRSGEDRRHDILPGHE